MARILTISDGSFDHKMAGMIRPDPHSLHKPMFLNENLIGKKNAYSAVTMKKGE